MAADKVRARWQGFPAELPDKTILVPGVTIVYVGKHEAESSEDWEYPIKDDEPSKSKGVTDGAR